MNQGTIAINKLEGGLDLTRTLESGQTFLWNRTDREFFSRESLAKGEWYYTATPGGVAMVRTSDEKLVWKSTEGDGFVRERLRLDDDLTELEDNGDTLLKTALSEIDGLRLVNDPEVPCLVSFICSSNMRVERIHEMQQELARELGGTVSFGDYEFNVYPTASELASATEDQLKSLKLGYRASWVLETASMISQNRLHPANAKKIEYKEAQQYLEGFTGVGPKVADCTLLFSLGFTEAIPLDTWIQSAVEKHYPACDVDAGYDTVTEFLREQWGNNAGYKQNYVFEYLRTVEA